MSYKITGHIEFPRFAGVKCYMMPVIQGRPETLPNHLTQYADALSALSMENGKIGYLTVDESYVDAGRSQRGYGAGTRTIHTEACLSSHGISWGPSRPSWGGSGVWLKPDVPVRVANSIDDTCLVWDGDVMDTTPDGDLSAMADRFPVETGRSLKRGEVCQISIWTPHEPRPQQFSGGRQFIRLVGDGVYGREPHFDTNDLVPA